MQSQTVGRQSRPIRIEWQNGIAQGGRIIMHWDATSGSIMLHSVAAFHYIQHLTVKLGFLVVQDDNGCKIRHSNRYHS